MSFWTEGTGQLLKIPLRLRFLSRKEDVLLRRHIYDETRQKGEGPCLFSKVMTGKEEIMDEGEEEEIHQNHVITFFVVGGGDVTLKNNR